MPEGIECAGTLIPLPHPAGQGDRQDTSGYKDTFRPAAALIILDTEEKTLESANNITGYFYGKDYAWIFRVTETLLAS